RAWPTTPENRVRGSGVRVAFVPSFPSSGSSLLIRAARRRLSLLLPGAFMLSLWQVCEALVPVAIGIVVDRAIIPLSWPMLLVSITGIGALDRQSTRLT